MIELGAGVLDQVIKGGKGWADVYNPMVFYPGCKLWLHNEHIYSATVTVAFIVDVGERSFMDRLLRRRAYGRIYFEPKLPVSRGEYLVLSYSAQ